jgi:hypothetical protein
MLAPRHTLRTGGERRKKKEGRGEIRTMMLLETMLLRWRRGEWFRDAGGGRALNGRVQVTSLDLERRALANIKLGAMYEGARSADEDGARNLLYISSRWVYRELKKS